jgi:hypothetical protein
MSGMKTTPKTISGVSIDQIHERLLQADRRIREAHRSAIQRMRGNSRFREPDFCRPEVPTAIQKVSHCLCNTGHVEVNTDDLYLHTGIGPKEIVEAILAADRYADKYEEYVKKWHGRYDRIEAAYEERQKPFIDQLKELVGKQESSENSTPEA